LTIFVKKQHISKLMFRLHKLKYTFSKIQKVQYITQAQKRLSQQLCCDFVHFAEPMTFSQAQILLFTICSCVLLSHFVPERQNQLNSCVFV